MFIVHLMANAGPLQGISNLVLTVDGKKREVSQKVLIQRRLIALAKHSMRKPKLKSEIWVSNL